MRKQRKEVRLLVEFLGYGMSQLYEHTALYSQAISQESNGKSYEAGFLDAVQRVTQACNQLYGPDTANMLRHLVLAEKKVYFFEPLDDTEDSTLLWLSNHGYDGELLQYKGRNREIHGITKIDAVHPFVTDDTEVQAVTWQLRPLSRAQGEQWYNNVQEDYHSFLACNGSASLAKKLNKVLAQIGDNL